ncbi:unnamed protein product [Darwinula stevensoni]|uniref:5'-nucleotidase n=1 Tax=Darwinula stevensoni TaxID=69355 RepID=A0A7R8X8J3_9CRUS|nr:unnamed protein product [Darwinula stevensoni]CAG0890192.1 unnamed protein product [Darwinula stevensoni]
MLTMLGDLDFDDGKDKAAEFYSFLSKTGTKVLVSGASSEDQKKAFDIVDKNSKKIAFISYVIPDVFENDFQNETFAFENYKEVIKNALADNTVKGANAMLGDLDFDDGKDKAVEFYNFLNENGTKVLVSGASSEDYKKPFDIVDKNSKKIAFISYVIPDAFENDFQNETFAFENYKEVIKNALADNTVKGANAVIALGVLEWWHGGQVIHMERGRMIVSSVPKARYFQSVNLVFDTNGNFASATVNFTPLNEAKEFGCGPLSALLSFVGVHPDPRASRTATVIPGVGIRSADWRAGYWRDPRQYPNVPDSVLRKGGLTRQAAKTVTMTENEATGEYLLGLRNEFKYKFDNETYDEIEVSWAIPADGCHHGECAIGDLVADAIQSCPKSPDHILHAIIPSIIIARGLPQGKVRMSEDVMNTAPRDLSLVQVNMTGRDLKYLFERAADIMVTKQFDKGCSPLQIAVRYVGDEERERTERQGKN